MTRAASGAPPGAGLFDCHFHIFDGRFALEPNHGYLPDEFSCEDYLARAQALGITGGAVVAASFQGTDPRWLLSALRRLGAAFVGVAQLAEDASDEQILHLARAGVRALRFNLRRGASRPIGEIVSTAHRVWELARWHVELYADAAELAPVLPQLLELPRLAIDHLGLTRSGLPTVLRLAANGVAVKASGFGRVDFDVGQALREIASANPDSLMFGTDLPSTRAPRAFAAGDIELVREALGEPLAEAALSGNARRFYGFGPITAASPGPASRAPAR